MNKNKKEVLGSDSTESMGHMQEYYWWSKDSLLFPNEESMMLI